MATEKKINSRIQQKHDVAANWAKATNFIPKKGEIIIYDAEYNASGEETQAVRFKIGDGSKTVNNLPFAVIDYSSDIETLEQKVANNSTAIGALQENTVPKTRKINNKALSSDITLGAADVGVNETTFPGLKKTGTVTGVKMNGTTKNPSSGVVDLGTVITAHQSIKSLKTDNTESQAVNPNEAIAGSGTINLHKVAKTGSYNDLLYTPTIPAAANNGTLTIQKNGTKVQTFTANQSSSVTANITVPTKVSELTNDSGYTTNKGTVTSVSVKMNGASKGTVTSSGTIDLGTVITSHQDISGKLDKTTYEWNKEFAAGSNGAISLGRYNIYDTQLTFDISSTTSASMNGKLVIATQNGRICQAKVFGDASGVLVSKIVIYQSAIVDNRSWIEIFCNFDGWSKNKVHIYGVALNSATVTNQMSSVTFTNGIPSPITSGDYGWSGTIDNDSSHWTGSTGTISIHRGSMTFSAKSGDTYGTAGFDVNNAGDNSCGGWSVSADVAHLRLGIDGACDIQLNENAGTSGQVLTSQGAGNTPIWTTPSGGGGDNSKHGYTQLTNEDLNTITEAGWYRAASGNTCTNRPSEISNNSFFLNVEKLDDTSVKQEIYVGLGYVSSHTRNGQSAYSGGTLDWSGWSSDMKISGFAQTFSGRKTFSSGINLTNSLQVEDSNGTSGQVLTSQGAGKAPQWKSMPTYTLSGTTLTITLP